MIRFDDVSKKYPSNVIALDDFSCTIDKGEFVFLVGPSGAGKSTVLRLLIHDLMPTKGSIFFHDWELNTLPSNKVPYLRRKIGFVFQDFKLLQDRTVFENISVALEILGKSKEEIQERIKEILDTVHLEKKALYFPRQLSLGEQQRVAVGRAIAGDIEVLLADEPTGNLDPKTSWEILKIINEINKKEITIIMATHNVDIVNSLKKRVIALSYGKKTRDEKKSKYS
ncbi:cell division ATP-binding protein FtsE [Candidatus Gottesmanbacteria bacterium]|nr:cell division ATP-binding protein FtsE [Candidatus Gottesmanbacteria bacterium]